MGRERVGYVTVSSEYERELVDKSTLINDQPKLKKSLVVEGSILY